MANWDRLREQLAGRFIGLYERTSLTETEIARRLDSPASSWSQTKVSRIRRGERNPTPDDARALALAMGADETTAGEIADLALRVQDERPEVTPSRVILDRGGSANFQRKIGRIESRAASVESFHPLMIHGLLQTEPYMLAIRAAATGLPASHPATKDWLAARKGNQAAAVASTRTYTMIMHETALWGALLDERGMAEQIDHIARIFREQPQWSLGVIPLGRPPREPPVYALHGFDVFLDQDERGTGVLYGTHAGTALVGDDAEITKFRELLNRQRALADFGESGREHLSRVAAEYRKRAKRRSQ